MRRIFRNAVLAGVAAALLAGCGGQAPEAKPAPKPEPKPLELVVSGVSDGGVVEGGAEVCVDVRNATSGFDAELTYSLSGPSGLRKAYGDYGVDTSTLDGSLSGRVPVSGAWCETLQPAHSGVYTITVRVPDAGLEGSLNATFIERQTYASFPNGITVPPGQKVRGFTVSEGEINQARLKLFVNDSLVSDSVGNLDDVIISVGAATLRFEDFKVWSNTSSAINRVELYKVPGEKKYFEAIFYTSD